jgi:hypothetical protein
MRSCIGAIVVFDVERPILVKVFVQPSAAASKSTRLFGETPWSHNSGGRHFQIVQIGWSEPHEIMHHFLLIFVTETRL